MSHGRRPAVGEALAHMLRVGAHDLERLLGPLVLGTGSGEFRHDPGDSGVDPVGRAAAGLEVGRELANSTPSSSRVALASISLT